MLALVITGSIALIIVANWTTIAEGFVLVQKPESANVSSIESSHSNEQYFSDNINGSSQSVVLRTLLSVPDNSSKASPVDPVLSRSTRGAKRNKRNHGNGRRDKKRIEEEVRKQLKDMKKQIVKNSLHMVIDRTIHGSPSQPQLKTQEHKRIGFWNKDEHNRDTNYNQKFATFIQSNGTVYINVTGLYTIYTRMGFNSSESNSMTSGRRSMFVVKIGRSQEHEKHEPKMRCMEIEKVERASEYVMEVCGKTGTFYLQVGDRISIHSVYARVIVHDINETFWGVIKV